MLTHSEASYGKQVLTGLVDASLSLALVTTLIMTRKPDALYSFLESINPSLLVLILFAIYRFASLLFFNQTIGMRLFGLILLNGEEQPLTYREKALAAVFVLFRGTNYYQLK